MSRRKTGPLLLCGLLAVTLLPAAASAQSGPSATGTPLSTDVGMYPTTVRLAHAGDANGIILTGTISFDTEGGSARIYESTDDGATFTEVGRITDPSFATGLCCGSMLELPRQVGDLPEGTLLWSASVGADVEDQPMSVPVWRSSDRGRTWSYLSTCVTASGTGGMWEPELYVADSGQLGCYYSDENDQPAHSQLLRRTVSSDGVTWSAPENIVAATDPALRPGMSVIRRLPDGRSYMSYEICGTGDSYDCAAYFRISADGSDWGDPADPGTMLTLSDGRFFAHAPKMTVVDDGTQDGRVITVGQELRNADGTVAEGNGTTLFATDQPGSNDNIALPAPVSVPEARNDPCPNYSSALAPLSDPGQILETATDYDENGVCRAYYATGPITAQRG